MEKNCKVSIITPLYNSGKYIEDTIKSVQSQTYKEWEMIIVDDCSTDRGVEIVEKYTQNDSRIRIYKLKKNSGAGICRNTAIKKACGKYIAFLDSDDLWLPEKLEKQIKFMEKNNYNFTFTKYRYMEEEGKVLDKYVNVPVKLKYKTNLIYNPIGCLTVIYNSKRLGKMFMPDITRGQDYSLWLKILKIEKYAYGLNETLSIYRLRSGSLSKNKFKKFKNMIEIYNREEKFNKVESFLIALGYSFYKIIKEKI